MWPPDVSKAIGAHSADLPTLRPPPGGSCPLGRSAVYNGGMRLRAGLVVGFAAGYYLGAKAGHGRYEQMHRLLGRAKRSDALSRATGRARGVVDLGRGRAKDVVDHRRAGGGTGGAEGDAAGASVLRIASPGTRSGTPTAP